MAKPYLEHLLGENERILLTSRQHWFILARSIFFEIAVILVIFVAVTFALTLMASDYYVLIAIVGFLVMLLFIASLIRDVLIWSNHQYIVTNWRVIQISGVINKKVIDSSLEKVNDVKMTQSVFGRIFDYGDVEILTASELGVNLFKRIEEPIRFKTAMINAKESLEHRDISPRPVIPDIAGVISQLDTLRKQGIVTEEEFQAKKAELLSKM